MADLALKEIKLMSVMKAHESRLIRYAIRFLKDESRARDVVQETFLRLWKEDFSSIEDHLLPWLFKVCRNQALDLLKREKKIVSFSREGLRTGGDASPAASALAMRVDKDASHVLTILETLPANQQEVIQLKFQNDLSYKEIAEITGFSVSNVGFLIHTGIKKIRSQIGESRNITPQRGAK